MIKQGTQLILLSTMLIGLACVPDTPTGNISDPISENYEIPTPQNFIVERLPNGNLQIIMDLQPSSRVSGQELFLMYEGELKDDLKFDINATIGLTFIDAAFLEFPQTYAIRSFYEFEEERIYSDFAYFTLEQENVLPNITMRNSLNDVLYNPNFYNPRLTISVEYAPDSVNFVQVFSTFASQKTSLILSDFQSQFEGDLDGVFRHKFIYMNKYESDYIATGSNRFSNCKDLPTPIATPLVSSEYTTLNDVTYFYVAWDMIGECYDEVFIYHKTDQESEFTLISRHSSTKGNTLIQPPTDSILVDLKVAGVRYGEGTVIESDVIRQNLQNN